MTGMHSLWLPILLSAVAVFLVSSVIHMAMPWHKSDYGRLENEDAAMDAMRPLAMPPGDYMVPRPASMAEMKSPAFLEKMNRGPVVMMTVMPNGMTSMGRNLALWFVYLVGVAGVCAYIAGRALPPGAGHRAVGRLVAPAALLGYTAALWQMSIWYRRSWATTIKSSVDGVIYALLTGALFAWFWPR